MPRKLLAVAAVFAGAWLLRPQAGHAMGGDLSLPSISIPVDAVSKKQDPAVEQIQRVLTARGKDFTGGRFINAHSELSFAGGTRSVNAALDGLARVDGVVLRVRFVKGAGVTHRFSPGEGADRPCDWSVEHNGWGAARSVTVTIYLGGGGVDPAALELPPVLGRADPKGAKAP